MNLEQKLAGGKKTVKSLLRSGRRVITHKIGRPQARYVFDLPPGVIPEKIQISLPGSQAKDFIIIPDEKLVKRSQLLNKLPVSSELQVKYLYSSGPYTDIQVFDKKRPSERDIESFEIRIVPWTLGVKLQFPKVIFCEATVISNNGCDFARIVLPSTKKEVKFK